MSRSVPGWMAGAVALAVVALLSSCGGRSDTAATTSGHTVPADCPDGAPTRLVPQVVRELPHATDAFTEGLVLSDGVLYESNGLDGRSSVRAIDPATGAVRTDVAVDHDVFAEGLAVGAGDELVQLTWKSGVAFRRDPRTLAPVGRFTYRGEGWGLTTLDDGTLVQSDGSDQLVERDPGDFHEVDRWTVARTGGPTDQLNELDWDGERLWANRWQTDEILRIDLDCDRVDAVVDASALTAEVRAATRAGGEVDVLNGIARGPRDGTYYVTGKLWPTMFVVRFVTSP